MQVSNLRGGFLWLKWYTWPLNKWQTRVGAYILWLPCPLGRTTLRRVPHHLPEVQQDWAPVAHTGNLLINANMLISLLFFSACTFWSHPSNKLLALKTSGLLPENRKWRHLASKTSGEAMWVKEKQDIKARAEAWIDRHKDKDHLCSIT